MRITHKSIFESAQYALNNTLEKLAKANIIVTTGKRINSLSDDPVGITQLLDVKSNLRNMDQLEKNISAGRTWLNAGESALDSVRNLLSEALVLSEQLATGTYDAEQREAVVVRVEGIISQIVNYSNTQVIGQYIFSGSKTDTLPFDLDDENNPTKVNYFGNDDKFSIKTGKDTRVTVGHDGEEVFRYSELTVDRTNNIINFKEYTDGSAGSEIVALIPLGKYTHEELATAMRDAMNKASTDSGDSITYKVDYDSATKKYTIRDNGSKAGVHVELLWQTGTQSGNSIAPYIGFDLTDIRDALVSDTTAPAFPQTIAANSGDMIFTETVGSTSTTLTIDIAGTYATGSALADALESALDTASGSINYDVTYDASNLKFIVEEAEGTNLTELKIVSNGTDTTALTPLGFTAADHTHAPPESDSEVDWSIFKSLFDLKGYLASDDQDGIARSMTILETHYKEVVSSISQIGSNEIRFNIREQVIMDLELSYSNRGAKIEDADLVEAVTNLKLMEFAYQSSLASSARVMQMSLADYL